MSQWAIEKAEFERLWEKMKDTRVGQTFQLSYASKQAAIQELSKKLGVTRIS